MFDNDRMAGVLDSDAHTTHQEYTQKNLASSQSQSLGHFQRHKSSASNGGGARQSFGKSSSSSMTHRANVRSSMDRIYSESQLQLNSLKRSTERNSFKQQQQQQQQQQYFMMLNSSTVNSNRTSKQHFNFLTTEFEEINPAASNGNEMALAGLISAGGAAARDLEEDSRLNQHPQQQEQQLMMMKTQNLMLHHSTSSACKLQHSYEETQDDEEGFNTNAQSVRTKQPEQQQVQQQYSSELYVWGRNQSGQLGLDPSLKSVVKIPYLIKFDTLNVKQVACGKSHTAFLMDEGTIYTLGSNKKGQLGIGQKEVQQLMQSEIVEALSMWKSRDVFCSNNSTFAIMHSGELFCWGSAKEGVLGLGDMGSRGQAAGFNNQYFPIRIIIDEACNDQIEVVSFSAGKNHVGAVCCSKKAQLGCGKCLYVWGSNKYGQLGTWDFETRQSPTYIETDYDPLSVACGHSTTIVHSQAGQLYSAGSNLQGQLGQGQTINKLNSFAEIPLSQADIQGAGGTCSEIVKVVASDFCACLMANGELYLWGPTPIGQFNSPQLLQDLIQSNDLSVRELSLGTAFGIIQDQSMQSYQIGSLFHEAKPNAMGGSNSTMTGNTSSLTMLENLNFLSFSCGHDFVVAAVEPGGISCSGTEQTTGNQYSIAKSQQKAHQRKRTNEMNATAVQMNNQTILPLGGGRESRSISPLRYPQQQPYAGNNTMKLAFDSKGFQQATQMSAYNGRYSQAQQQTSHQQQLNQSKSISKIMASKDIKHRESCTPVRESTANNALRMLQQQTPSQANTPHTLRLRIQHNQPQQPQIATGVGGYVNSFITPASGCYQELGNTEFLSQTLVNTPQQLRKTFGGLPPQALNTYQPGQQPGVQQQQYINATPTSMGPSCQCSQGNPILTQSVQGNFPHFYQSIEQPYQGHAFPFQSASLDFILKEKQELHHQLNIEQQRRMLLEQELAEVYRQLEQARSNHSPSQNVAELQHLLELSKRESENLLAQFEDLEQQNRHITDTLQQSESNLSMMKKEYEELESLCSNLSRENEHLKAKLELSQLQPASSAFCSACGGSSGSEKAKKELEEAVQKKSKEIYELTVQLGCLKEENHQMKRDLEDMGEDFQERLRHQQIRAEADLIQLQDELNEVREQLSQGTDAYEEQIRSLRQEAEKQKEVLCAEVESYKERLQQSEDAMKIQKREIQILQSEQEKLLKRLHEFKDEERVQSKLQRKSIEPTLSRKQLLIATSVTEHDMLVDMEDLKRAANELMIPVTTKTITSNSEVSGLYDQQVAIGGFLTNNGCQTNLVETPADSCSVNQSVFARSKPIGQQKQGSSNRDQGCLQVTSVQPQRRKSTQMTYTQQSKTLRNSQNSKMIVNQQTQAPNVGTSCGSSALAQSKLKTPVRLSGKHDLNTTQQQPQQQNGKVQSTHALFSKSPMCKNTSFAAGSSTANKRKQLQHLTQHSMENEEQKPTVAVASPVDKRASNGQPGGSYYGRQKPHNLFSKINKKANASPLLDSTNQSFQHQYPQVSEYGDSQTTPITPKQLSYSAAAAGLQKTQSTSNLATNGGGDTSAVKSNLIEMKSKLQDIQSNKMYLEKKIYEYEKKLNELRGMSHEGSLHGGFTGGNQKISTLSTAILEKVLNPGKE